MGLLLNLLIVVIQVVFGVRANSLGLLADAGHNLIDVLAVALSFEAVRLVARSPTEERSFGYHRASILAAQANALRSSPSLFSSTSRPSAACFIPKESQGASSFGSRWLRPRPMELRR
jgi:hypothetical protein